MPGKRATSRVERAIMLLTALKPDNYDDDDHALLGLCVAPDRPTMMILFWDLHTAADDDDGGGDDDDDDDDDDNDNDDNYDER